MPSFQSGKEGSDSIAEDMYTYPQRAEMQRTLSDHLEMAEKSHILHVLRENDDNRELTAKDLEISLRSLYYKLKKYGIH
jgi:transcriptional regulator with PAS, ATPase and Fis domain